MSAFLTNFYLSGTQKAGNYPVPQDVTPLLTQAAVAQGVGKKTVSLLRSLSDLSGLDEISARSSSSLPPLFAPGRFAAFLYSGG